MALNNSTLIPLLGVYGIVIVWIQKGKVVWGTCVLLFFEILRTYPSPGVQQFYFSIVAMITTIGLGIIFRNLHQQVVKSILEANRANQEKHQIATEIKQQIADLLHSTVASDLARIFILAEKGLVNTVNLDDISVISKTARNSSTLIRKILTDLNSASKNHNLSDSIDSMKKLLETQAITLNVEEVNLPISDSQTLRALSKFINEVGENIFKYGKPGSVVDLGTIAHNELIEITVVNKKVETKVSSVLSSGIGLKNCAQLFHTRR